MKSLFTVLVIAAILIIISTTQADSFLPLPGNLNGDNKVDLSDLRLFADQWLDPSGCAGHPDDCADLTGNDGVDLADFSLLSANYGKTATPLILKINEILASNYNIKADEAGDFDDWIEIYNPMDEPVDIGGLYLSDSPSNPAKWRIPSDNSELTTIDSKGFLLIWVDNEPLEGPLHATFGLDAFGDQVILYDADSQTVIDRVDYGEQKVNFSFGRYPDGADTLEFFNIPTSSRPNISGFPGRAAVPELSHERGFYSSPFSVTITTSTPGAEIYYTTNSERPKPGKPGATLYTGPIPINSTTALKVAAYKPGFILSRVIAHTYIFVDDVIAQPYMSTTITQDPVWGPQMHDALLEIPTISLITPYTIENYPQGDPADVEVSIEMILPDGTKGFQANAGVERFGGAYSEFTKQALRISFKKMYGPTRLDYDLFSDTPYGGDDTTDSFNQIILRQGSQDCLWYDVNWASTYRHSLGVYTRNRYCFDRQFEMGQLSLRGKFVHVYLNGVYWGQYHLMERPTADFMAQYEGGEEEDYDIMKGRGGIFCQEGTRVAWDYMVSHTSNYEIVKEYMDVDNYIDYMLLNFYAGNDHDWYSMHNWVAGRKRQAGSKFKFFMWDNDYSYRRLYANTIDNGGPSGMFNSIKQHSEFKMRMADRAQKYFFNGGMLTPERVQADFTELNDRISRTLIPEYARWSQEGSQGSGQFYTPDQVNTYVDWIKYDWGNVRTDMVVQQMRDAGIFPSLDAPVFNINGVYQFGGYISTGDTLNISNPNGYENGIKYYTLDGSDPRLVGGNVNPASNTGGNAIPLDKTTLVKARILSGSTWSALNEVVYADEKIPGSLRISEIMYHPADPDTGFIELENIGTEAINLNLVKFTNGVDFTFGDQVLNPGQYTVVVQDIALFQTRYPAVAAAVIAGQYTGKLDNDGERIELVDALGTVIHNFNFKDGWFDLTDGLGYSLTVVNTASDDLTDWDDDAGWRSSLHVGGTPGQPSLETLPADCIVINEILSHSHAEAEDWIELYNTTDQDINIGGWFLSDDQDLDDPSVMKKYQIPDGTVIQKGEYKVFMQNDSFGNQTPIGNNVPFGLSEDRETLYLHSGQGGELTGLYMTEQEFDASQTGVTFGRYEKPELSDGKDFVRMTDPTKGTANTNSSPLISDIVITEIHYDPIDGGDYEFVELYNRSAQDITLMTEVTTYTSETSFITEWHSWRIDGIGFDFPDNTTIPAHSYIVVAKDPAKYSSLTCEVYDYDGKLSNDGEEIELEMPGDLEYGFDKDGNPKERYWIPVEKIDYKAPAPAPWPDADNNGKSLQRIDMNAYGRDYSNWTAATPTPGQ